MTDSDSFFELYIEDLNSSGQGVGTQEGLKIFVDLALPQEKVQVKMVTKKKKYACASLEKLMTPSPDRVKPICPIFELCGGCQIMHLDYSKQLEFKRGRVLQALRRIGKIESLTPLPCLSSPMPLSYRNKIQLPFFRSKKGLSLGLYQKHSNAIVEVKECFIHCALGEKIYHSLLKLIEDLPLTVYDPETKKGFLRHLLIRTAVHTQETLIVWITSSKEHQKELRALAEKLMALHPEIKGVLQNVNRKRYNSILGDHCIPLKGQNYITEEIAGYRFKISSHAFFQVNPWQAAHLYQTALDFADLKPSDRLLDAYCGIGMFSILASKKVKSVIGIESVAQAIEDAKENAKLNSLHSLQFKCAFVEQIIDQIGPVDVAIINPPRKGCEEKVLKTFAQHQVKKLVYVSCDPASLARDCAMLITLGYTLIKVQPLDMFPQTTHVESIALLTLP